MDLTHLHLLLNHFPIIGTIIGVGLMAYALIRKENSLQKAVLGLWVIMTLFTFPVMKTGEEAEETVENLPGMSHDLIHEHEEAAEWALWLMIGLGVISLFSLVQQRRGKNAQSITMIAFVVSLVVSTAMARTGYLGGQIRHTEIQSGGTTTQNGMNAAENEEDED